MKITILTENTTCSELKAEHGLSFFIEENGKKYLLDAGQSGIFYENAEKMGVHLEETDYAILSHGHYDHAGGFYTYFEHFPDRKVYAAESADGEYYSSNGGMHEIGIPKPILKNYGDHFIWIPNNTQISSECYLIRHDCGDLSYIGKKAGLFKKSKGEIVPDDFMHEISLVFDTEKGLVIFNSCSHAGVANIISDVKKVFPKKHIYAFLGGLHMKGKKDGKEICAFSEEEIKSLSEKIEEEQIDHIYSGHCTGEEGFRKLKEYLGNRLNKMETGKIIEL